ncbi:tannase/feruloyl esterase family alpha/beta hydrolase [Sciscionella marina]|uniref:tannase/feruloyl esterase family alpha/beta hydrolase n=1 Tax=Sciscionella marina TaxID=508770 RepID=UPI0003A62EF5|nr:tannase/feruloyl esterase family alpha/beta hydrolase [Sciscionella marina]
MSRTIQIAPSDLIHWVTWESIPGSSEVRDRCNPQFVASALSELDGARVVSVDINSSGECELPAPPGFEDLPGWGTMTGLPEYCEVRVEQFSPGGATAQVTVWVPLDWNGRFLGTAGSGNRTNSVYVPSFDILRVLTPTMALKNGFATATTDGGVGLDEPRMLDWQLDEDTGELNWDLIQNWAHRSAHEMTIIGKAVTETIHGEAPEYSYFCGCSGGGRQALVQAQRYPDDYDGVWASDPAINWTRLITAELWPALVMKEYHNPLSPAKLRTFRTAALTAYPQRDQADSHELIAFDASAVIGTNTPDGEITATDAEVMQQIWDGPRAADGEFLWYGLHPGAESWGDNILKTGLCMTQEQDGGLVPAPFEIAASWFRTWLLKDSDWDWTTLTFESYEELFRQGVQEFAEVASDSADLSGLRDSGGKLILSHALNDELIFSQGSIDYYKRAVVATGEVGGFFRLFCSPGDGHSHVDAGPGLTIARGMAALMEWVEEGKAPDSITAERFDLELQKIGDEEPVPAFTL